MNVRRDSGIGRGWRAMLVTTVLCVASCASAQEGLSDTNIALLEKAKSGDAESQFRLANAYDSGRGAPRDGKEAMRWYMAAAEQGHAESQNSVGSGLQAEKHFAEALTWYQKASLQDHALATNNLAFLYDEGLGVKQDRQKAFDLYMKSADLEWGEAMFNLYIMYGAGQIGAKPDLVAACPWYFRAVRYAEPDSRIRVNFQSAVKPILKSLSGDELRTCRDQAVNWKPAHAAAIAFPSK
jgi:uncharacterized protein